MTHQENLQKAAEEAANIVAQNFSYNDEIYVHDVSVTAHLQFLAGAAKMLELLAEKDGKHSSRVALNWTLEHGLVLGPKKIEAGQEEYVPLSELVAARAEAAKEIEQLRHELKMGHSCAIQLAAEKEMSRKLVEALEECRKECSMEDPNFGDFTKLQFAARLGLIYGYSDKALAQYHAAREGK